MSITIRRATPGDAEAIAAIHVASWQATYAGMIPADFLAGITAEQRLPTWTRILGMDDSTRVRTQVATLDGEVCGFSSIGPGEGDSLPDDTMVLTSIYLSPGLEGKGAGRALLTEAEHAMRDLGARHGVLWVLRDNARARGFHEARGWVHDPAGDKIDQIGGVAIAELRYRKPLVEPG